jgi:hypothetical protein
VRFLKISVTESMYGGFPGGDPRLFHPDEEGRTDEEREAHRKACEAWDKGGRESESDGTFIPGVGFIDRCQFGMGSYEWTEEIWLWDWLRWVWLPRLQSRVWWWWNLDVNLWLKARGWKRD